MRERDCAPGAPARRPALARRRLLRAALAAAAGLGAGLTAPPRRDGLGARRDGATHAQTLTAAIDDLRVEWDLGKDRRGNVVLSGYVYNARAGYWASHVQLRVTGTDRTGKVIVDTRVYVYGDVPPQGRSYFEVRVPSLEPTYRVTVTDADFRGYGTGA